MTQLKDKNTCPCGMNKIYSDCCEPIIKGTKKAETAEQLMRSRYTAYNKSEIDYLIKSTHISQKHLYSYSDLKEWADKTQWQRLEILSTKSGLKNSLTGEVEFKAYYLEDGIQKTHHELSFFKKENDLWYFVSGKNPNEITDSKKVGRNEPCICGSGKKYKKCCG